MKLSTFKIVQSSELDNAVSALRASCPPATLGWAHAKWVIHPCGPVKWQGGTNRNTFGAPAMPRGPKLACQKCTGCTILSCCSVPKTIARTLPSGLNWAICTEFSTRPFHIVQEASGQFQPLLLRAGLPSK